MPHIHRDSALFSCDEQPPVIGGGWETVSVEDFNALRASGWSPSEYVKPWRVSKDTIITRVRAAHKLPEVIVTLATQPAEEQFVWDHSAWFWSTNATLRGLCTHLQMDPDAILARDEFLF